MRRWMHGPLAFAFVAFLFRAPSPATGIESACAGDCDRSGKVTLDELLAMVRMSIEEGSAASCLAADRSGDGRVQVAEIIAAVGSALKGCAASSPPPTPEPEFGSCYESANCFPCDVYPCRPTAMGRDFCCQLAMHGGSFSWCSTENFDRTTLSCTACEYPCK